MDLIKIAYVADGETKDTSILVFKYKNAYFTAGYNNWFDTITSGIDEEPYVLLPLIGSIDTRIPDLRLPRGDDYKTFSDIVAHVEEMLQKNKQDIDRYLEESPEFNSLRDR